jgi:hypothetical protein
MLRPGNVHNADRWKELLEPIVQRYENKKVRKYFRGDAAFAKPEIYEYLEEYCLLYAIRLRANDLLYDEIKQLLIRPVGRPFEKACCMVSWFQVPGGYLAQEAPCGGKSCHKKGDIRRDSISDQSITMLFIAMSCFFMRSKGQVSLILGFLKKSNEYQRKWWHVESWYGLELLYHSRQKVKIEL